MHSNTENICEGQLYEIIELYGTRFEIRYGYYEDFERAHTDPLPIYPLFHQSPVYTPDGYPFATKMQEPCDKYSVRVDGVDTERCAECIYFQAEADCTIGICKCEERRLNTEREENT